VISFSSAEEKIQTKLLTAHSLRKLTTFPLGKITFEFFLSEI